MLFHDRSDAGRQLAEEVAKLELSDVVVFAVPSSGVPVAFEVAKALQAPLDVIVVQKLTSPLDEGVTFGAVSEDGLGYVKTQIVDQAGASRAEIEAIAQAEMKEVQRRLDLWRGAWPPYPVEGKTALIVDDGIVTGDRARAAALVLHERNPAQLVIAVPVGSLSALRGLEDDVDGILCLHEELALSSLERVYEELPPVTDREVATLLERAQTWTVADRHDTA